MALAWCLALAAAATGESPHPTRCAPAMRPARLAGFRSRPIACARAGRAQRFGRWPLWDRETAQLPEAGGWVAWHGPPILPAVWLPMLSMPGWCSAPSRPPPASAASAMRPCERCRTCLRLLLRAACRRRRRGRRHQEPPAAAAAADLCAPASPRTRPRDRCRSRTFPGWPRPSGPLHHHTNRPRCPCPGALPGAIPLPRPRARPRACASGRSLPSR